jgi:hypothetical protein
MVYLGSLIRSLTVFDSRPPHCFAELALWREHRLDKPDQAGSIPALRTNRSRPDGGIRHTHQSQKLARKGMRVRPPLWTPHHRGGIGIRNRLRAWAPLGYEGSSPSGGTTHAVYDLARADRKFAERGSIAQETGPDRRFRRASVLCTLSTENVEMGPYPKRVNPAGRLYEKEAKVGEPCTRARSF